MNIAVAFIAVIDVFVLHSAMWQKSMVTQFCVVVDRVWVQLWFELSGSGLLGLICVASFGFERVRVSGFHYLTGSGFIVSSLWVMAFSKFVQFHRKIFLILINLHKQVVKKIR